MKEIEDVVEGNWSRADEEKSKFTCSLESRLGRSS